MLKSPFIQQAPIHPTLEQIYDQALAWVNSILLERGIPPVEQLQSFHDTAWSVVAKVNHQQGAYYFKFLADHIAYELAMTQQLAKQFPQTSVPVIAVDVKQRFMLIADLGTHLFDCQPPQQAVNFWQQAMKYYAQMQLEIAEGNQSDFVFLPDRCLENIPELAMPIIEHCVDIQPRDGERAITAEDVEHIRQLFKGWPERLAAVNALAIPNSIHHGDLHGGNIAVDTSIDHPKPVCFDWGDSSWSHPFVTYFISADACQHHFNLDASELKKLQTAYLTPWLGYGSMTELTSVLEQVNRISPLVMLISWAYAISNKADERTAEWESGLCTWVNEFLRLNRD